MDIDLNNTVMMLNKVLASDPKLAVKLISNRPQIENDVVRDILHMSGNKVSFLAILNGILKDHGSNVIIGADCDFDDGDITRINFFHLVEVADNVKNN